MPRWQSMCKPGEMPSSFYEGRLFEARFGIKSGFGPVGDDGKRKWNRGWSDVPHEWAPAIDDLLSKVRAKYRVEALDDPEECNGVQVVIDQIKVKWGELRFYYHTRGAIDHKAAMDEIDGWVDECEKQLKKDDPHYGVPY